MCFLFSLLPATILVVVGYFVLFSSKKTDGAVRSFGRVLAFWLFLLALLPPVAGAYVTITGQCPMDATMQDMHQGLGENAEN